MPSKKPEVSPTYQRKRNLSEMLADLQERENIGAAWGAAIDATGFKRSAFCKRFCKQINPSRLSKWINRIHAPDRDTIRVINAAIEKARVVHAAIQDRANHEPEKSPEAQD